MARRMKTESHFSDELIDQLLKLHCLIGSGIAQTYGETRSATN